MGGEKPEMFGREYLLKEYERISLGPAIYRPSALIQGELSKLAYRGRKIHRVLDMGCGTANSTFALAEVYKGKDILYLGLDLSEDALMIAQYKQGGMPKEDWEKFTAGIEIPPEVIASLETKRASRKKFIGKTALVRGKAEAIPLKNSIDIIHCVQSLHWTNLPESLAQIKTALRNGGLFIFDETGFQFDFSDLEVEGKQVNGLHFLNHPFHTAFITELNKIFQARNLPELGPKKIDRFHHMFNLETLRRMLNQAGFSLKTIDYEAYKEIVEKTAKRTNRKLIPFDGKEYKGLISPRTKEDMERYIVGGGQMRYFNSLLANKLSDEEKGDILKVAFTTTSNGYPELLEIPVAETLAFFVAKAE